ncbi:MAG: DUF2802 domain-containing protein [Azonexus sp.]|nr:DUF2802 domain-containing protein [Azonexus sp.]
MDFGGVTLGLREGVIVLITLVAAYILFVLLRMFRLHKAALRANAPPAKPELEVPVLTATDQDSARESSETDPWEKTPPGLAEEMLRQSLEQEVAQLRDEVDAVRGELAALRQDMLQELTHLQATQAVSPIYGDAMQLAAAGYDSVMIAERCGIARAEAELVVALAKSQER